MRKWLTLLLALAIVYALSKLNTKRRRERYPFLKRVNEFVNILVWVLFTVYLGAFCYWLWTEVLR